EREGVVRGLLDARRCDHKSVAGWRDGGGGIARVALVGQQGVEAGAGPGDPLDLGQTQILVGHQRRLPRLQLRQHLPHRLPGIHHPTGTPPAGGCTTPPTGPPTPRRPAGPPPPTAPNTTSRRPDNRLNTSAHAPCTTVFNVRSCCRAIARSFASSSASTVTSTCMGTCGSLVGSGSATRVGSSRPA